MGNSSSDLPPPSGARVLRCKELYKLKQDSIDAFWKVFKRFDLNREGFITRESFFKGIIREERNEFGDAIFLLVDTQHNEHLEFGEFLQAVCTFCCFSVSDMLKFCFRVYDKDRSGSMGMEELHHSIMVLHNSKVSNNVEGILSQLHLDDLGRLPFDDFKDKTLKMGNAARQLKCQKSEYLRDGNEGMVNELEYWRENREYIEQMENSKKIKKKKRQRDAQIRKAMGLKEYFLNPKKRQIYVEALSQSQSVPTAPPPGTAAAAATPTPFSKDVAPR